MNSKTAHNSPEGAPASIGAGNLSSAGQQDAAARPADGICPGRGSAPAAAVGETRVQKQHAVSVECDPQRPHASCKDGHDSMRREGDSAAAGAATVREKSQLQVKELQTVHADSCSMDPPKKRRRPSPGGCLDGEEESPCLPSCSVNNAFLKSSRAHSRATGGCHGSAREGADARSSDTADSSSNSSSIYEANASSSNTRTDEGVDRDSGSPAQENNSHSSSVADVENKTCSVRSSGSIHRRPSKRNVGAKESASYECNNSTSSTATDSREDSAAVNHSQQVVETGEPNVSSGADSREDAGRTSRVSEFCSSWSSSSKEKMRGIPAATSGRGTTSNTPTDCKRTVAADARDAGERECNERGRATVEEGKSREGLSKEKEGRDRAVSSFAWGLWPRPLAPSEALESPSLLLLAAAGKKFQTEEQAKAFLETLTEEHKQQLQRRHYRVATQMLHVPPFEPLPREKFRHEAPPVLKPGVVEHSALRTYAKKLSEQEKQLKALQLHDIVFTNLYPRLRDLFPERSDAALYRMCKITCALAKRQGLPRVLQLVKDGKCAPHRQCKDHFSRIL